MDPVSILEFSPAPIDLMLLGVGLLDVGIGFVLPVSPGLPSSTVFLGVVSCGALVDLGKGFVGKWGVGSVGRDVAGRGCSQIRNPKNLFYALKYLHEPLKIKKTCF